MVLAETKTARVLVVDDDADIREVVVNSLRENEYLVTELDSPDNFASVLETESPSLVILDIGIGSPNGLEILESMRNKGDDRAVILVTSRAEETDRVRGLDLGADDYVTKPFSIKELQSRIRAVLRRHNGPTTTGNKKLVFGSLEIDPASRSVTIGGKDIYMTRIEFGVLEYLAARAGVAVTRTELLEQVWGSRDQWQDPETVTEHVRRVRSKLSENDFADCITTLRGVGYRFDH